MKDIIESRTWENGEMKLGSTYVHGIIARGFNNAFSV